MPLQLVSATPAMRPRLSEVVLDHLMEKILAGTLRPGDELPSETELATAFQVSKPTVRDALRHLSALGLVEIRQGRPSTIGQVSPATLSQLFRFTVAGAPHKLQDIIAVRRAIECLAAPAAARNITDAGNRRTARAARPVGQEHQRLRAVGGAGREFPSPHRDRVAQRPAAVPDGRAAGPDGRSDPRPVQAQGQSPSGQDLPAAPCSGQRDRAAEPAAGAQADGRALRCQSHESGGQGAGLRDARHEGRSRTSPPRFVCLWHRQEPVRREVPLQSVEGASRRVGRDRAPAHCRQFTAAARRKCRAINRRRRRPARASC